MQIETSRLLLKSQKFLAWPVINSIDFHLGFVFRTPMNHVWKNQIPQTCPTNYFRFNFFNRICRDNILVHLSFIFQINHHIIINLLSRCSNHEFNYLWNAIYNRLQHRIISQPNSFFQIRTRAHYTRNRNSNWQIKCYSDAHLRTNSNFKFKSPQTHKT